MGGALIVALLACSGAPGGGGPALTDEAIAKYVAATANLREIGPGIAERFQTEAIPAELSIEEGARIEDAVKKAGFSSYAEFVQVGAKIGWAFSSAEGRAFLSDMDQQLAAGMAQLDEAVNDPNTPEDVKAQLRAQKAYTQSEFARNRKWATPVLAVAGAAVDDADFEVILRHRAELEAAFQGK